MVSASTPARAELVAPPRSTLAPIPASELVPSGIDAVGFVLVDAGTGQVLLSRAPDERRAVASTIKVLTALTAVERLDAAMEITVGDEVRGIGGSDVGLVPGATWGREDLLEGLLVRSGNEAAEALAVAVAGDRDRFVELMREDARALGIVGATITEPSGLEDGNLLSASDLAVLGRAALGHPEIGRIVGRSRVVLPGLGEVENRNLMVGTYPGATGVKTGFTSAAGNVIIASARRGDRELIVVLLGSGPDPTRFRDAARLLDVGFESFEERLAPDDLELASATGWWTTRSTGPERFLAPVGTEVTLEAALPALLGGEAFEGRLLVGTHVLARFTLVAEAPQEPAGARDDATSAGRLAEAVADGVLAGLRAAVAADRLG